MINFNFFIENKNKNDNYKFKLCLKINLISQLEKFKIVCQTLLFDQINL